MWLSIISFLGGPVVSGLIKAYQAKLAAGNTSEKIASDLAAHEIAAQTMEIQATTQLKIAEIGHPYEPEKLAFYVWLFYFAKCVIWDTIFGLGSTPPLYGAVAIWSNLIVGAYFTKRGFENVARILKR